MSGVSEASTTATDPQAPWSCSSPRHRARRTHRGRPLQLAILRCAFPARGLPARPKCRYGAKPRRNQGRAPPPRARGLQGQPEPPNRSATSGRGTPVPQTTKRKEPSMAATNINRVVLTGNLTSDPELRQTPWRHLGLQAAHRLQHPPQERQHRRMGGQAQLLRRHRVGRAGRERARYLSKGRPVAIDGRLEWREWEAQDGTKRQATDIIADSVQFPQRQMRSARSRRRARRRVRLPARPRCRRSRTDRRRRRHSVLGRSLPVGRCCSRHCGGSSRRLQPLRRAAAAAPFFCPFPGSARSDVPPSTTNAAADPRPRVVATENVADAIGLWFSVPQKNVRVGPLILRFRQLWIPCLSGRSFRVGPFHIPVLPPLRVR